MSDVTRLLESAAAGDRQAAADLLPLVYDELRKFAAARMAEERPGQTLQSTSLVHEAYLRLIGDQRFDGRGHFFAAAAESMRRILVEAARRKGRAKRGDGRLTSGPATFHITVATFPLVTLQPVAQTAFAGTTVKFRANADSTAALTVRWQVSTDGGQTFQDVPGAVSLTLTFKAETAQDVS